MDRDEIKRVAAEIEAQGGDKSAHPHIFDQVVDKAVQLFSRQDVRPAKVLRTWEFSVARMKAAAVVSGDLDTRVVMMYDLVGRAARKILEQDPNVEVDPK